MTTSVKMEEDRSHMTERILNLTLEIIYLLTGQSFPLLKSGDHVTITVPPCDSLKPDRRSMQKILEVNKKITELLTGEIGNLRDYNDVKEEFKEEDEEDGVMKELSEEHKDLYKNIMVEPPSNRNPPERCPRPLYSRDSTQEDLTIPHHDQSEDVMKVKVEGEEEETNVWDDQQYTEEDGMMRTLKEEDGMARTIKEEDTPTEIITGHAMEEPSKDRLTLSPGCKMEDEDITADCAGEETMSSATDGGLHSMDRPWNPSDSEQPHPVGDGAGIKEKTFSCPECGESFDSEATFCVHLSSHMGGKYLNCYECGKCFFHKKKLVTHYASHTGTKPYSCPECGKSFLLKTSLTKHQTLHTGAKPYSCSECGKCFTMRSSLNTHKRLHTGEKPFSCPECGKSFSQAASLSNHKRSHTGEKPFSCPECGKSYSHAGTLFNHQKSHLKEKPYSCSECGKGFSQKWCLTKHQSSHT